MLPKRLKPVVVLGAACAALRCAVPKVEPAGAAGAAAAPGAGLPNWKAGAAGVRLAAGLGPGFGRAANRKSWAVPAEVEAVAVVLLGVLAASGTPKPKLKAGFVPEPAALRVLGRPAKTEGVSVAEDAVGSVAGAG